MITHPKVQVPSRGPIYSINEGNAVNWDAATKKCVESTGAAAAQQRHNNSDAGLAPTGICMPA